MYTKDTYKIENSLLAVRSLGEHNKKITYLYMQILLGVWQQLINF